VGFVRGIIARLVPTRESLTISGGPPPRNRTAELVPPDANKNARPLIRGSGTRLGHTSHLRVTFECKRPRGRVNEIPKVALN
jgi:hypothetical protein